MPGARWFPGGTLNYAEQALAAATERPGDVAVIARSQTRGPSELTWAELSEQVARAAAGLRRLGVGRRRPGRRLRPQHPRDAGAVPRHLRRSGAIWSTCAPEFGVRAVVDRFAQIEPSVLLAVDGYRYGERDIDRLAEVEAIRAALPSLRHVVRLRYLGTGADDWTSICWPGRTRARPTFEPVPFDHPLWVLYSSGTTGLPKAIVHGHGGTTVEHLKFLTLHQDLRPDDRFGWFTTTGWMMWNLLMSGLLTGAAIVVFDGDPNHRGPATLWDLAAETGSTVFGVSAPFLMACRKAGLQPARAEGLRWVGSTGAPLPAEGARWVHDALGVPVSSISGGHRRVRRLPRHRAAGAGAGGGDQLPPARLRRRRLRPRRAPVPARRDRRAGRDRADAVDAGRLLGRRRRQPLPGRLLRGLPRRLAPRRLDHLRAATAPA